MSHVYTSYLRRPGVVLLLTVLLVTVVRVACFPFTWETADAPARIALAIRWLRHPTLMSVQDCSQFGPLPICLIAGILTIWNDPYTAPRFLSLLFGAATVFPLFVLTRLLFNARAALFAALFFAFYSLQVKACGTAMAEAPFGFLFLASVFFLFRFRRDGRTRDLVFSALLLTLASMVRYEGWLYIPLLGLLAIRAPMSSRGVKPAVIFLLLAAILPVLWMVITSVKVGDALWTWRFIFSVHAQMSAGEVSHSGTGPALLYRLLFLPAVLFLSLTPLIAVLAVLGLFRTLGCRQALAYATLLLPFIAYFLFTLALAMSPMARLLTTFGLLLLPYAGAQMDVWTAGLPERDARRRTGAVLASAACAFGFLFIAALLPAIPLQQKLWSVAPVSPFLPEHRAVYNLVKSHWKPGEALLQDSSPHSHIITFNVGPAIYENWWARPPVDKIPTPKARVEYLEKSAPGLLLLDRGERDLDALLEMRSDQIAEGLTIRIEPLHVGQRYALYRLWPKGGGPPQR